MDREGRAIAYQFSFKPMLFSKLASKESDSWHWIFIDWLGAFGIIEIINKYIITWFNRNFYLIFTKNLTFVKGISKSSTPMITTGLTDKNCQAVQ